MLHEIEKSREKSQVQVTKEDILSSWINGQLSKATRKAYLRELISFLSWISNKKVENFEKSHTETLQMVGVEQIVQYRNLLSETKAPATAARSLSALKSLFKYLLALDIINKNPTEYVKLPKVPQESDTIALNQREIETVLNAVEMGNKNSVKKARDRLIMLLLFVNGLRRSEVCKVKLSDFDRYGEYDVLRVHSKGGGVDVTKIKPMVKTALNLYVQELEAKGIFQHCEQYLFRNVSNNGFVSHENGGITTNAVYLLFKKYAILAELPTQVVQKLHPHSARHSAITIVVDHAGIHKAMQFARHSDPKTTMRYYRRKKDLSVHGTDYINYEVSFAE